MILTVVGKKRWILMFNSKILLTMFTLFSIVFFSATLNAAELFGPKRIGNGPDGVFAFTSDGKQVVYADGSDLWVSYVDGTSTTLLTRVDTGEIQRISLSANDQRIVFLAVSRFDFISDGRVEDVSFGFALHGISINGGNLVTYADSDNRRSYGQPHDVEFEISPDSKRIAFTHDAFGQEFLFSQAIEGGDEYIYNTNQFGRKRVESFQIAPDSSVIIFIGIREQGLGTFSNSNYGLYSAPLIGGTRNQLDDIETARVHRSSNFSISPDNSFLFYSGDPIGEAAAGVFRVPLEGGVPLQLNDESIGDAFSFTLSPNGSRIIYRTLGELYSVSSAGGAPISLLTEGGVDPIISPNSNYVVYRKGSLSINTGTVDLYSVPILGGDVIKLNSPLLLTGSRAIDVFKISPDSLSVVYTADKESIQTYDLYVADIRGASDIKVNEQLQPLGDVLFNFMISLDNQRVVYIADQRLAAGKELFSVKLDGTDSTLLSTNATEFAIDPMSARVVKSPQLSSIGIDGPQVSDDFCFVIKGRAEQVMTICL